jgi:hypothetical protein
MPTKDLRRFRSIKHLGIKGEVIRNYIHILSQSSLWLKYFILFTNFVYGLFSEIASHSFETFEIGSK